MLRSLVKKFFGMCLKIVITLWQVFSSCYSLVLLRNILSLSTKYRAIKSQVCLNVYENSKTDKFDKLNKQSNLFLIVYENSKTDKLDKLSIIQVYSKSPMLECSLSYNRFCILNLPILSISSKVGTILSLKMEYFSVQIFVLSC